MDGWDIQPAGPRDAVHGVILRHVKGRERPRLVLALPAAPSRERLG